ncbi:MAG: type II secretion system protein [Candidatus Paceibacterota bacterium]
MGKRTNNNRINKQGFTLLETIVAIAILALAIMGPMELAARSIGLASVSKNQIVAFYLAQDAMEYVKNVRDANFLTPGANWLDGFDSCRGLNGCYIDVPRDEISACTGDCPVLKYDSSGLFYNYAAGENSVFTRTVKITDVAENTNEVEVKVRVTVLWNEKTGPKTFTIEDNIFNWIN